MHAEMLSRQFFQSQKLQSQQQQSFIIFSHQYEAAPQSYFSTISFCSFFSFKDLLDFNLGGIFTETVHS